MNKKIIIIVITILIVISLIITSTNKTFFKNYYEIKSDKKIPLPLFSYYEKKDNNNVIFYTFRRVNNVRNIINNYIENLHSCYDESYFYDSDLNVTISKYYIEDKFPLNKIYLTYIIGNYCENEYILEDNWINYIKNNTVIEDINIEKCIMQNNNINCDSKNIKEVDINELFNYISKDSRIQNKDNISIKNDEDYYSISYYYSTNNKNYTLSIFKYNNYLAFKITDANDHSKNAIYNINKDVNKLFKDIYNK